MEDNVITKIKISDVEYLLKDLKAETEINTMKDAVNNAISQKSQVQIITWEADD